ncbi:MAG: hypothetical protein C7B45_06240, partial [Sulfobacillus acidophilus]
GPAVRIFPPTDFRSDPTSPAVWRTCQLIWHDLQMIVRGLVNLADWRLDSRAWTTPLLERPRKRLLQCDASGLG